MIICFFLKQIELLLFLLIFKVNMTFKWIKIKNFNEIIFAKYSNESDKCKFIALLMH